MAPRWQAGRQRPRPRTGAEPRQRNTERAGENAGGTPTQVVQGENAGENIPGIAGTQNPEMVGGSGVGIWCMQVLHPGT